MNCTIIYVPAWYGRRVIGEGVCATLGCKDRHFLGGTHNNRPQQTFDTVAAAHAACVRANQSQDSGGGSP